MDFMEEDDVIKYLRKNKDNIIVVFGQKIHTMKRSEIKKTLSNPDFCYIGEDTKRYYQILGRPLLSKENMLKIIDRNFSIFNISLLINVIKVFSDSKPKHIHNRSIYELEAYGAEDYEMLEQ
jgi:hypothetical protein